MNIHLKLDIERADFDVSVDVLLPAHGITVIYGPSGCGKTTLLRCVAGLEPSVRGVVQLGHEVWQDDGPDGGKGVRLPTHQRALGYVFQEASLFDHLDVAGNLAYGHQRAEKNNRNAMSRAVQQQTIELLGIGHLLKRRSHELSGGERQRVAIARALVTQPRLLLLDEPLAALDHARRQDVLPWLEKLRDDLNIPMLYVTHAVDEVARLADTLVVMNEGRVQANGPVAEVLTQANLPVVLGEDAGALLTGVVLHIDTQWHLAQVGFAGGALWVRDSGLSAGQTVRLRVLARDVSVTLHEATHTSIQNHVPCVVEAITPEAHPSQALLRLRCGDTVLLARVTARGVKELGLHVGLSAWAQVKSVALVK
jgi:molybdate transport system ATP-binding protein